MPFDISTAKPLKRGGFDISTAKPVEQEKRSIGGFIGNIPGSIAQTAQTYSYPLFHPIKTARGMADLGAGIAGRSAQGVADISNLLRGKPTKPILGGALIEDIQKAEEAGRGLKERYATKLGQSLYEDPVGMLTDAAFLIQSGGSALGKMGGVTGKTGKIISKAAQTVNPVLQTGKLGAKAAQLTGKGGSTLLRTMAGVFPETVKQTKRIGMSIVGEPIKRTAGYFTEKIVPRVKASFNQILNKVDENTSQFLKKSGVSDSTINSIKKHGIKPIQLIEKRLPEKAGSLVERIKKGLLSKDELANKAYKAVFSRSKSDMIPVNQSVKSMQAMFTQSGIMDADGVIKNIEKLSPNQKGLVALFDDMRTKAAQGGGAVTKQQYSIYRDRITDLGRGVEFENKLARRIKQSMNLEAADAIPELKQVNKMYHEKMRMMDDNFDTVKQSLLEKKKLDLATRKRLKELDDFLPNEYKFLNDLEQLKAADEIGELSAKYNDSVFIESQLKDLSGYKNLGTAKIKELQDLYRHFPDKKIVDDALSGYLAQDLFQPVATPFQAIPRKVSEATIRGGLRAHEFGTKKVMPKIKSIVNKLNMPLTIDEALRFKKR